MAITIGNVQIKEGDKFRITKNGEMCGFGNHGDIISVFRIFEDSHTVGVVGERYNPAWGDLDGTVEPGHGYYMNYDAFRQNNFERIGIKYVVIDTFKYNELDLNGKPCVVLHTTKDRSVSFVEFEEDIGGGGCDGLGKNGHCIAMPSVLLSVTTPKKTVKTTAKDKSEDVNF